MPTIKLEIEVHPFEVPSRVVRKPEAMSRETEFKLADSIPLSMLDKHTLTEMIDDWINAVYLKAGIRQV